MSTTAALNLQGDSGATWGDQATLHEVLSRSPLTQSTNEDENGIRTDTIYYAKENGTFEKLIQKVRVVEEKTKTHKAVLARRNMRKFGAAARGTSENITIPSYENITIEKPDEEPKDESSALLTSLAKAIHGKEASSGAGRWKEKAERAKQEKEKESAEIGGRVTPTPITADGKKYVVPAARGGGSAPMLQQSEYKVKVSELSTRIDDQQLKDLCSAYGKVVRYKVIRDARTGVSRGFGFATFLREEDAKRAIADLNGKALDYLILRAEWAKPPRNTDPGSMGALSGGHVSGYGKKLAQDMR